MMPGKNVLLLLLFPLAFLSMKADKPAYRIFDSAGHKTDYEKMVKAAKEADIVFFGENHDNPICHWLELELTKDLYEAKKDKLVLGAEMLEADNQVILDEYLKGYIKERNFKDEARLWPNYQTDYRPLVAFARENHILFVATNVPRRYASVVAGNGLEYLDSVVSPEARKWIAPLPIWYDSSLKCYKDMLSMMPPGHSGANMPKAQALKDATMAYFISKNRGEGKLFLHYNGAYHSNNRQGIVSYLLHKNPALKIVTISSTGQPDVETLDKESQGLADFIICTPEDMTKTMQ